MDGIQNAVLDYFPKLYFNYSHFIHKKHFLNEVHGRCRIYLIV
jgi:hypothetical protein